ncbi:transporter [Algoriphagus sp.]|uniref:transporter n=1 Tax=Algoriphagus sp. TaxID=1872435 RepID=UPI00391D9927
MKKIYLLVIAIIPLFNPNQAKACDSCNFFEYSLLENKSFFGLFYRSRKFDNYLLYPNKTASVIQTYPAQLGTRLLPWNAPEVMHEPEGNGLYVQKSKQDFETYQTIEARGNYTLKNKWNFTFLLPYEFNKVYYEKYLNIPKPVRDTTLFVQGWGDLTLATDYIHLIYNPKSRHTLRPGIAVTLPTGQALVKSAIEIQEPFDPIIQPGRGAFSFIPRFNYQWFLEKQGINIGMSYQWSTEGEQEYEFGNSFNAFLQYFYQVSIGQKLILVPNAGLYFESAEKDLLQGIEQELTGGKVSFAQVGVDLNYTKTTFSFIFQKPFSQTLNGNQILNQNRISVGLIRSFKM